MADSGSTARVRSKRPRILLLAMLPVGDTIWLGPTTRALRERYPFATMTALTYRSNAPLAALLPGVDDVMRFIPPHDRTSALALPGLIASLRDRRFDWAITFTSPGFKWISLLAGIPHRAYMKFDRLWWLIPRRHERWRSIHATEHYYDTARELGLPPWERVDQRPAFSLPGSAQAEAARFLQERIAPDDARSLITIHPGGAGLGGQKRWPAERFALLIRRLWDERRARALILGGSDEISLAESIARAAWDARPIVAAGKTTLLGSFALVERSCVFLGNDSSLLHAAAALGTPYVGIFGPTSPASFRPIPSRPRQGGLLLPRAPCPRPVAFVGGDAVWRASRCVGASRALESITVDDAYTAVVQALADATSAGMPAQ